MFQMRKVLKLIDHHGVFDLILCLWRNSTLLYDTQSACVPPPCQCTSDQKAQCIDCYKVNKAHCKVQEVFLRMPMPVNKTIMTLTMIPHNDLSMSFPSFFSQLCCCCLSFSRPRQLVMLLQLSLSSPCKITIYYSVHQTFVHQWYQ